MSDSDTVWTWQNSIVRIAFLLTIGGTIVIFVWVICVLLNVGTGNPGSAATPLLLLFLVMILVFLTGFAIEREKVKHRLPKITKRHVIVAFLATVIVWSVKSFPFGLCIGITLIMSTFLLKSFEARIRGIAVCACLTCLVTAEAIRRAGGYDSGGVARYALICYAALASFLPGLLVISTMRVQRLISLVVCGGFFLLTMHSTLVLIAGMSTVLDNTFEGRSQGLAHEYCIDANIPSPVGLIVDAFRNWKFPPYKFTNVTTTTTTRLGSTTTIDCLKLMSLLEDASLDVDNSSNFTNGTDARIIPELDMSHCVEVPEAVHFDPNSTTTTSTSTTSTSTTSTSTTSTTSTTTTSTTTTSTTTTTTSTTTSTTSTTTSTITTTLNDTTTVTTMFWNTTLGVKVFMMTEMGQYCPKKKDITTEKECRAAAKELGQIFANPFNGPGNHKYCHFADDGRSKVFFNYAGTPSPHPWGNYASLCHKVTPWYLTESCVPGTPETQVSDSGTWAMGIYFLAGMWVAALWFVVVLVGSSRHAKVHPEPTIVEGEDPYGLEAFRHKAANSGIKRCRRVCKKICKVILMSIETVVGTAVFVISGIALVVTGGVKLPMEKPECAKAPRTAGSLIAWAEEPAQRYRIVWCEYGSVASVGLAFFSFCCFLLCFSMSFGRVLKFYHEDRKRRYKAKLRQQRLKSAERGEAVEEGPDLGAGFRVAKMIPQDVLPESMYEDYDGRVFDC